MAGSLHPLGIPPGNAPMPTPNRTCLFNPSDLPPRPPSPVIVAPGLYPSGHLSPALVTRLSCIIAKITKGSAMSLGHISANSDLHDVAWWTSLEYRIPESILSQFCHMFFYVGTCFFQTRFLSYFKPAYNHCRLDPCQFTNDNST
jgi:hypothetical protein